MADGGARFKTEHKCEGCGKYLTEIEIKRYDEEFGAWARKHPDWETQYDARDRYYLYLASGTRMDCDACAVERLQTQRSIAQSTTFMDRVAQGGPEGFWVVAVVILGILLFCFAR